MPANGHCSFSSMLGPPSEDEQHPQVQVRPHSCFCPHARAIWCPGVRRPQLSSPGHWANVPWAWDASRLVLTPGCGHARSPRRAVPHGRRGVPRDSQEGRSQTEWDSAPLARRNLVTAEAYPRSHTVQEMFCDHPCTRKAPLASLIPPGSWLCLRAGTGVLRIPPASRLNRGELKVLTQCCNIEPA